MLGRCLDLLFATNEIQLSTSVCFMVVLRAKTKLSGPAVWSTVFMVKTIKDTQKATSAAGGIYKPVIYTGVGYAFLRKGMGSNANVFEQAANRQAWERLLELLNKL